METNFRNAPALQIGYLDGGLLRPGSCRRGRSSIRMAPQLNEINVFPVADHDTGSNMAATMRGLAAVTHLGKERSLAKIIAEIADSGLMACVEIPARSSSNSSTDSRKVSRIANGCRRSNLPKPQRTERSVLSMPLSSPKREPF